MVQDLEAGAWISIWAYAPCSVALSRSLSLSEVQFLYLVMEIMAAPSSRVSPEDDRNQ